MRMLSDTVAKQSISYNTAASGSDSTITITPEDSRDNVVIDWLTFSYAADPTSGSLTITDTTANTVLLSIDITSGGPGELGFAERGLICPRGNTIQIQMADGTQTKKLTVSSR